LWSKAHDFKPINLGLLNRRITSKEHAIDHLVLNNEDLKEQNSMLTRTFFHKKSHSSIEPSIFVKDSQLTLPNVVRV